MITVSNAVCHCTQRVVDIHTDTVIWLGDFNYRIGLGPEAARSLVKKKDLATLYENDQVCLHRPEFIDTVYSRFPAEPANGSWSILSVLFGGAHHVSAHLQVRSRDGRLRYFVSGHMKPGYEAFAHCA